MTKIDPIVLYEIYCRDCGAYLEPSPRPLEEYQFALCPECRKKARLPNINIPFTEDMAQASLEGRKHATSRPTKFGNVGDTFYIKDVLFELIDVWKPRLMWVAQTCFAQEGFDSPEAFEAKWKELHPRKGFVPEQKVWFHEYKRAE